MIGLSQMEAFYSVGIGLLLAVHWNMIDLSFVFCSLGCTQQLLGFTMLNFLVLDTEIQNDLNHHLNQWPCYNQLRLCIRERLHLWTLLILYAASE